MFIFEKVRYDTKMIKIVTHSGGFHADDVFAVAAFQLLLGKENVEVTRTRDEDIIATADYVVDVGGVYDHTAKRYDHHQNGAPVRDNGIPYAGFGLMWQHYGEEICGSKEVADYIEEKLCQQVDAGDNGVSLMEPNDFDIKITSLDGFIKEWQAAPDSDEVMDVQFEKVVEVIREYLRRKIAAGKRKVLDTALAKELYEKATDKRIIVSDIGLSSKYFMEYEEVEMVIFPSHPDNGKGWMAIAVPLPEKDFEHKVLFPAAWGGLTGEVLVSASGIVDARFCHRNLFLAVFETKEAAIAAASLAR